MVDLLKVGRILSQVAAVLTVVTPAFAQEPITSNRPGISESEALLVPRAFQIESGFTFGGFSDGDGRHRAFDLPEAWLRFGVTPGLELFATVSDYNWDRASLNGRSETTTGGSDLSINAKLGWLSEEKNGITLNAAAGLSFPIGSDAFSNGGYDPSFRLLWSRSLPRDFGLSGNLDVTSLTAEDDRVAAAAASVGVSHPLNQSTSWFVELFGNVIEGGEAQWQLDGGVAIVTSDDFQIDLSVGRTLQSGPSAWFAAAGISLRHRR